MTLRKVLKVMFIVDLVALMALGILLSINSNTKSKEETGPARMMGRVPTSTEYFVYTDFKSMRDTDALYAFYRDNHNSDGWEDVEDIYGIHWDTIDNVAYMVGMVNLTYSDARLYEGSFGSRQVRERLKERDYDKDSYEECEVWQRPDPPNTELPEWVALKKGLVVAGNQEIVKACLDILEGKRGSLRDVAEVSDMLDRTPGGFRLRFYRDIQVQAGSNDLANVVVTQAKRDSETIQYTWIYRFENEESASNAVDAIDSSVKGYEGTFNQRVRQDGQYIEASLCINIDDFVGTG